MSQPNLTHSSHRRNPLWNGRARRPIPAARPPRRAARGALLPERLEGRVLFSTYTVTNLLDHGAGSLRQAILDANAHAGADVVTFAPSLTGLIGLTTGQLTVTDPVQIKGPGASALTVNGNGASRIFKLTTTGAVTIGGLTLTNANPGFAYGGAILSHAQLTLSGLVISNNVASSFVNAGQGVGGAGLMNFGTATVVGCYFKNNQVFSYDTTLMDGGGAVYNAGTLTVRDSTFANNSGQTSPNAPLPVGADVDVLGSNGGAIYNAGALLMTNSTLFGNSANVFAGGLFNYNPSGHAVSILVNCTLAGNHGTDSGGLSSASGSVSIGNCIIAGNSGGPVATANDVDVDLGGVLNSLGRNLIGIAAAPSAGDLTGNPVAPLDPLLGPLANNGGPTRTMAITAASPAYNAGSATLVSLFGLNTDQRGLPRNHNGAPDIGAFEL